MYNHFKGKIKLWCNENRMPDFAWQARFHDRIIREWDEYNRIATYIKYNIRNWTEDKEFLPCRNTPRGVFLQACSYFFSINFCNSTN